MSALAEALVAAQAELPCALGKDANGQIGQRSYAWQSVLGIAAEEDTDGPADPTADIPF